MTAANIRKDHAFDWEDDTKLCADHMSPHLRALVDYAAAKYKNGAGAVWALHWGFADLLFQFEGDRTALETTVVMYADMREADRAAAQDCKERVQQMLIGARLKGFSTTSMAYTMMAALSKIHSEGAYHHLPRKRAEREANDYIEGLVMALNKARRATMN
jgi:hypothetical protein